MENNSTTMMMRKTTNSTRTSDTNINKCQHQQRRQRQFNELDTFQSTANDENDENDSNNSDKITNIFLDHQQQQQIGNSSLSMQPRRQQSSAAATTTTTNMFIDSLCRNKNTICNRLPSRESESERERKLVVVRRRASERVLFAASSPNCQFVNLISAPRKTTNEHFDLKSPSSASSPRRASRTKTRIVRMIPLKRKNPKLISSLVAVVILFACSIMLLCSHETLPMLVQSVSGLQVSPSTTTAAAKSASSSPSSVSQLRPLLAADEREEEEEALHSNQVSELTAAKSSSANNNDQERRRRQQHANKNKEQLQLASTAVVDQTSEQVDLVMAGSQDADEHQVPPTATTRQSTSSDKELMNETRKQCSNCQQAASNDEKRLKINRRQKRHLTAAESNSKQSASNRLPDCQKLTTFWLFLQSQYPAFSKHLLDWSTASSEQSSDEQFLWSKTSQIARTLGRLLEEAERIVAAEQHQSQPQQQRAQHSVNHHSSASWLTRVSSKPAYARLMQHLRAKQQQQHPNDQPEPANVPLGGGTKQQQQQVEATTSPPTTEMLDSNKAARQQIVYGKVINYPHEIGDTSNSLGMARTLEKLRILNRHNKNFAEEMERHQKQQADSNSILETNKIPILSPPIISEAELDGATNWRRAYELADEARSKFVYGNVILQPPQKQQDNQELHRHQNTLSTLHELANEEQINNKNHESMMDSNGRLSRVSTLGRLKQQLDSGLQSDHHRKQQQQHNSPLLLVAPSIQQANDGDTAMMSSDNNDELANQQRSQQMAAFGGGGGGEQVFANTEEEFEGDFHAGPLQRAPEVRQLRSVASKTTTANEQQPKNDNNNDQQQQQLQHKDSESIPNNGVFIVE